MTYESVYREFNPLWTTNATAAWNGKSGDRYGKYIGSLNQNDVNEIFEIVERTKVNPWKECLSFKTTTDSIVSSSSHNKRSEVPNTEDLPPEETVYCMSSNMLREITEQIKGKSYVRKALVSNQYDMNFTEEYMFQRFLALPNAYSFDPVVATNANIPGFNDHDKKVDLRSKIWLDIIYDVVGLGQTQPPIRFLSPVLTSVIFVLVTLLVGALCWLTAYVRSQHRSYAGFLTFFTFLVLLMYLGVLWIMGELHYIQTRPKITLASLFLLPFLFGTDTLTVHPSMDFKSRVVSDLESYTFPSDITSAAYIQENAWVTSETYKPEYVFVRVGEDAENVFHQQTEVLNGKLYMRIPKSSLENTTLVPRAEHNLYVLNLTVLLYTARSDLKSGAFYAEGADSGYRKNVLRFPQSLPNSTIVEYERKNEDGDMVMVPVDGYHVRHADGTHTQLSFLQFDTSDDYFLPFFDLRGDITTTDVNFAQNVRRIGIREDRFLNDSGGYTFTAACYYRVEGDYDLEHDVLVDTDVFDASMCFDQKTIGDKVYKGRFVDTSYDSRDFCFVADRLYNASVKMTYYTYFPEFDEADCKAMAEKYNVNSTMRASTKIKDCMRGEALPDDRYFFWLNFRMARTHSSNNRDDHFASDIDRKIETRFSHYGRGSAKERYKAVGIRADGGQTFSEQYPDKQFLKMPASKIFYFHIENEDQPTAVDDFWLWSMNTPEENKAKSVDTKMLLKLKPYSYT